MSNTDLASCAQRTIDYEFQNPDLLILALTHSSVASSRLDSNERLEFLGDAVLGTAVCAELFDRFPDWAEGDLTKVKSVVVSRRVCACVADEIGLTKLLKLGNGIDRADLLPISLRAAVFESVIGAIFLDGGFEKTRDFILRTMATHIDECVSGENRENFKSSLQQHAQRWLSCTPRYQPLDEQGPDHSKCFEVCVTIGSERFPSAWGPTKKQAEQEAARRALEVLQAPERTPSARGHL